MRLPLLDQNIAVLYLAVIMGIGFAMKRRATRADAGGFWPINEIQIQNSLPFHAERISFATASNDPVARGEQVKPSGDSLPLRDDQPGKAP